MPIPGTKFRELSAVMRRAFTLGRLRELLRFRLEKELDDIALGQDYQEIAFKVIDTADKEGWLGDLVEAMIASNPRNAELQLFVQSIDFGLVTAPSAPSLERIIRESNSFLDIQPWRVRLGMIERQVCRIEIKGSAVGTGFLVGPDVIMTNYHVVEDVINQKSGNLPTDIVCRFDYKVSEDGSESKGNEFALANEWLIDFSPYSSVDTKPHPKPGQPALTELDYALLRLKDKAGELPIGSRAESASELRGWIDVPELIPSLHTDDTLIIVQHPKGAPMKIALETQGIIEHNQNDTRVTYRTNTDNGSSGSPCFNQNWEWVALHHSGDPAIYSKPNWNEGIPLKAILGLLEQRGKKEVLGKAT